MWFVLERQTEKTVAMTSYKDAAEIIAASFPAECVIRWADINFGCKESKFFTAENKSACA